MRRLLLVLTTILLLAGLSCEEGYVPLGPIWQEIELNFEVFDDVVYDDLKDLEPFGLNDVWLVGENGLVYHYRADEDDELFIPCDWTLFAVDMINPSNGFACGEMGTVLHYNGFLWEIQPTGFWGNLYDIIMFSWDDAWAVGEEGTVLHYDGNSWQRMPLFYFDGENWQPYYTTEDLRCIDGLSSDDVWICGTGGILFHWDGNVTGVIEPEMEDRHTTLTLNGIKQIEPGNFYVCGAYGFLAEYDNGVWTDIPTDTYLGLNSIDINGDLGFVVGNEGRILSFDGESAELNYIVSDGHMLNSVVVTSPNEAWACGNYGGFLHYR